jgi:predicted DNA-binding transcriptional regulator YafY
MQDKTDLALKRVLLELIRTVLGYAGEIEVLQPESLREILSERIHQMATIYLK